MACIIFHYSFNTTLTIMPYALGSHFLNDSLEGVDVRWKDLFVACPKTPHMMHFNWLGSGLGQKFTF